MMRADLVVLDTLWPLIFIHRFILLHSVTLYFCCVHTLTDRGGVNKGRSKVVGGWSPVLSGGTQASVLFVSTFVMVLWTQVRKLPRRV